MKAEQDICGFIIICIWYWGRSMKILLQQSIFEKINDSTNCLRTDWEVYILSLFRILKSE